MYLPVSCMDYNCSLYSWCWFLWMYSVSPKAHALFVDSASHIVVQYLLCEQYNWTSFNGNPEKPIAFKHVCSGSIFGIRVLKSFNREAESIDRFSKESNEYKRQSMKLTRVQSLFFPIVTALIGISTVLTVYAGSVEAINGSLTFGNIAEFVIYVNLLTWPVTLLGWTSSQVQRFFTKRINEFLKQRPTCSTVRFSNPWAVKWSSKCFVHLSRHRN